MATQNVRYKAMEKKKKYVSHKKKYKVRGKPFGTTDTKTSRLSNGRKKGSKNKFTTLKQAFFDVFHNMGGIVAMQEWAEESSDNRKCFYQMIARMLPREVSLTGTIEEDIKTIKVEILNGK